MEFIAQNWIVWGVSCIVAILLMLLCGAVACWKFFVLDEVAAMESDGENRPAVNAVLILGLFGSSAVTVAAAILFIISMVAMVAC